MESSDVVDDVNALLRLGVGDQYRLEHIKLAYMDNKTVWESDRKYLEHLREKYLTDMAPDGQAAGTDADPDAGEDDAQTIHCWKCGRRNLLKANFCMACGISLFDIGAKPAPPAEHGRVREPATRGRGRRRRLLKLLVIIGIPAVLLGALGAAYTMGYLDGFIGGPDTDVITDGAEPRGKPAGGQTSSKCGPGTSFDPVTNTCAAG